MSNLPSDLICVKEFLNQSVLGLNSYNNNADYPTTNDDIFNVNDLLPNSGFTKDFRENITETFGLSILEERKKEILTKKARLKLDIDLFDGPFVHNLLNKISVYGEEETCNKIQMPDVMIKVHFYKSNIHPKAFTKHLDFDVLGQSTLTSLKDKLKCFCDLIPMGNFAENPDAPVGKLAKDEFKSSFFFIEGTFYNDLRQDNCMDISEPIMEWANNNKSGSIGPFKSELMEGKKFIDLNVKLNYPYLYVHQGNCEHIFKFSDIRLVTNLDCIYFNEYPVATNIAITNKRHSCICCKRIAKWNTVNSSFAPEDPCFFCDLCLKMLHYDKDGNLIDPGVKVYRCPGHTGYSTDEFDDDEDFEQ